MTNFTKSYTFATPSDYIYDATYVTIASETVTLTGSTSSGSFSETFATSSGFTYNTTYIEFDGALKQKSTLLDDATFGINFNSSIDANWASGSATGSAVGGASVTGGRLDLAHGDTRYVSYLGADNASSTNRVGAVRFKYTPNYSTNPASSIAIFSIGKTSSNALMTLFHFDSGILYGYIYADNGSDLILAYNFGSWNPTAGQLYQFEYNWDIDNQKVRLYIDGLLTGGVAEPNIETRTSNNITKIGIGYNLGYGTDYTNFYMDDFVIFSAMQHTVDGIFATITYSVTDNLYMEASAVATYSETSAISSYSSFSVGTTTNSPKFILDGRYWSGSAWVNSDGSYSSASSESDINTNIGSLGTPQTLTIKSVFQASNATKGIVDDVKLYYNKGGFPITNPTFVPISTVDAASLVSLGATFSTTGSDDTIKFVITVNGIDKYVTGGSWTNSTNYSQSNTLAEINAEASSLLSSNSSIKPKMYLHAGSILTKPTVTNLYIGYTFGATPATAPEECTVYGYLLDNAGSVMSGATIKAKPTDWGFLQKNYWVSGQVISTTTNSAGYFELSLIRNTERTGGSPIRFDFSITPSGSSSSYTIYYKTIPDQASIEFNDL